VTGGTFNHNNGTFVPVHFGVGTVDVNGREEFSNIFVDGNLTIASGDVLVSSGTLTFNGFSTSDG
jgi:phosphotransferase system IIA component